MGGCDADEGEVKEDEKEEMGKSVHAWLGDTEKGGR